MTYLIKCKTNRTLLNCLAYLNNILEMDDQLKVVLVLPPERTSIFDLYIKCIKQNYRSRVLILKSSFERFSYKLFHKYFANKKRFHLVLTYIPEKAEVSKKYASFQSLGDGYGSRLVFQDDLNPSHPKYKTVAQHLSLLLSNEDFTSRFKDRSWINITYEDELSTAIITNERHKLEFILLLEKLAQYVPSATKNSILDLRKFVLLPNLYSSGRLGIDKKNPLELQKIFTDEDITTNLLIKLHPGEPRDVRQILYKYYSPDHVDLINLPGELLLYLISKTACVPVRIIASGTLFHFAETVLGLPVERLPYNLWSSNN